MNVVWRFDQDFYFVGIFGVLGLLNLDEAHPNEIEYIPRDMPHYNPMEETRKKKKRWKNIIIGGITSQAVAS